MANEEERYIWLNGDIVKVGDAKINVLAPTAQFGANVFEGIRCYFSEAGNQLYAFRLEEHYKRLQNSAKLFRMKCPYSTEELKHFMIDVVKANGYREDIAVRQTLFVDGYGSWFSREPVGMFIAPIAKKRIANPIVKGEKTCVSSWERISDRDMSPRIKVGANYINSRMAKLEAMDNGFGAVFKQTGICGRRDRFMFLYCKRRFIDNADADRFYSGEHYKRYDNETGAE